MSPSISLGISHDNEVQSYSSGTEGSLVTVTDEAKMQAEPLSIDLPTSPVKEPRSPIALLRSPTRASAAAPAPILPPGAYKQRFRSAVHRVIAVRRASAYLASGHIGAEPGIDPRRASANSHYGHIRQQCVIEIVDYSVTKCSVGRMSNHQLVEMLASPEASKREPWARVRWINVGGVSWDVLSALALRYGALHKTGS